METLAFTHRPGCERVLAMILKIIPGLRVMNETP
jgi:hypothetical protein